MILDNKQRNAFQTVLSGLKFAKYGNKKIRFLTLTTSDIQFNEFSYSYVDERGILKTELNDHFQVLYKRIKRYSPYRLYKEGYISENKLKSTYRADGIFQKFDFEYFRVETNEGNGVLHILFRGSWLPYNFLVDNWMDIHNSWDLNIKLINMDQLKQSSSYVVSQYMSSQNSSYVRSSQSWKWVFRGFKTRWHLLKYQYNNWKNYFEVDKYEMWDNILKETAENYFYPQKKLADFG